MASSSTAYMHAAVAFSKVPGTLSALTSQVLTWVPSSSTSSVPTFTINYTDIAGLQTSKAGAAQTALMIALSNGVQIAGKSKVLLVFNAAAQTALDDREKFKNELATAVAKNRASQSGPGTPDVSSPALEAPTPGRSATATAAPSPAPTAKKPAAPVKTEMELRISVLRSNPSLRALHKDVVLSGAVEDAEFWSHPQRQALVRAERANLEQRQGRNAKLADPKPTPNEAGELKLSITPELIRDLFEQFPVVARAYDENVPSKLDEGAFWTRYFQSKLYHRLRTSARSAASEHIVQDDPIFDQYLEDEDDQLEPRKKFNPHDRLLDLGSTQADHEETGNEKDWTMRAGAERKTLPLMRRFNDHSQSLLDSALGEQEEEERKKRRKVGGVGEEYAEIVIDDLNETAPVERVRLDVRDLEGYFQSHKEAAEDGPRSNTEIVRITEEFDDQVAAWTPDLGRYKPSPKEAEAASKMMQFNIRDRTQGRGAKDIKTLPEPIQKQVLSCQAAATEFLRQFWAALAPPGEEKRDSVPTRKARAKKMQASLRTASERMESVAMAAEEANGDLADREKVWAALSPTLSAVRKALGIKL